MTLDEKRLLYENIKFYNKVIERNQDLADNQWKNTTYQQLQTLKNASYLRKNMLDELNDEEIIEMKLTFGGNFVHHTKEGS